VPHIFTDEETIVLLEEAAKILPHGGLRPATCRTVIGLLASTGLRISEAVNLMQEDFDSKSHVLYIRKSKFHKERFVPIHPSVSQVLQSYEKQRDRIVNRTGDKHFFLFDNGKSITQRCIRHVLRSICKKLDWKPRGDHRNHRLHDLRHTFIVRRVLENYKQGIDPDRAILSLATYVGHVKVADTYWYLTGIPELMSIASHRFQGYFLEDEI